MGSEQIDPDKLVAYAAGELSEEERGAVEALFATAPDLRVIAEELRDLLETLDTDDSEPPTPAAIRRARAAMTRGLGETATRLVTAAGEMLARLVFDSRAQPALAGYRGGAPGFHVSYECELARVDLMLSPVEASAQQRWSIRGRITPASDATPPGTAIALRESGAPETTSSVDSDPAGHFEMEAAAGIHDLLMELDGTLVTIPQIEIG